MTRTPITIKTNPYNIIMKPLRIQLTLFALLLTIFCCIYPANTLTAKSILDKSNSLTSVNTKTENPPSPKRNYVEFSIINDTETDYNYYVAGSVEIIKKGTTRTFSSPEGIDIYHVEKGEKGKIWFKISLEFNKKAFKLSEITKDELLIVKE